MLDGQAYPSNRQNRSSLNGFNPESLRTERLCRLDRLLACFRESLITASPNNNDSEIPWGSLARMAFCAQAVVKKRLKQVAVHVDLTSTEALLLITCLDNNEGISQQKLVKSTGCSAGLVSSQIEALQTRALVTSHRNPDDRRHQYWQITDQGKVLADELLKQLANADWDQLRELGRTLADFSAPSSKAIKAPGQSTDDGSDRGLAA